ncbi:MAG: exodeoxyribonuclease VII large subunit [Verrucomicrobiales bacterium]
MPSKRDRGREPVYSVTEVTRAIKKTLEGGFTGVWIEGEVSNHRCPASGHHYFTLKDSGAQIACVLFRGQAQFNQVALSDGLQVQISGDISVYENRGQYQLIAKWVQPKGLGALQAKFEALKAKLNAERLFDSGTKIAIPRFPKTIAVVTSPTGAAIQDILNVINRRAPWVRVLVMPVAVQGQGSEREIETAIRWLSKRPKSLPEIDTLIVARGGGSLEDLWSFNDEGVARAIYECPIPVISGVGHEIDFTIADFVADRREPTPSAAAEFAVPDGEALKNTLRVFEQSLESGVANAMHQLEQTLDMTQQVLDGSELDNFLENRELAIAHLIEQFDAAASERLFEYREEVSQWTGSVDALNPEKEISYFEKDLERLESELDSVTLMALDHQADYLENQWALLESISPQAVMKRGFSMTLNQDGSEIASPKALKKGDRLRTVFFEEEVESVVDK